MKVAWALASLLALVLFAARAGARADLDASCRAAIDRGARDEAIHECAEALQWSSSNTNVRALAQALVSGQTPPTPGRLAQALDLVSTYRERAPTQPTLIMASCDIAERIGDGNMLQNCADDLRRVAPSSPEAREAEALLARHEHPWRLRLGWSAIALAVMATLVSAVRRRLSPRLAAGAVAAAVLFATATARAEDGQPHGWLSKWPIDDGAPETSIPSAKDRDADPLQFGYWIQDLALKGERASKSGDHLKAARFYEALATAVPDRAVGMIKACEEYEAAGDQAKAIDRCGAALLRDGTMVKDHERFVRLLLAQPGALSDKDRAAISHVLEHLRTEPAAHDATMDLACEVGARTSDAALLRECTTALAAKDPNGAKTLTYQWALAVTEGDIGEARALRARAGEAGVGAEALAAMDRRAGDRARGQWTRWGLGILAAALLAGVVVVLRGRRGGRPPTATPPLTDPAARA